MTKQPHVCQVAITALDGQALREWYVRVFGLVRSGKMLFFPPSTTRVQGIPGAWEKVSWALDQQDYFQLEIFQFLAPRTRPRPRDWRPCDIGYNMVGIAVRDFEQVLRNIRAFPASGNLPVSGEPGKRRACVADPEGNLVEIYERDPLDAIEGADTDVLRPEIPAVFRTLRASVPNLQAAREDFVNAMGFQEVEDYRLHSPDDEAMWGLPGACASTVVLRAKNFLLELVEYQSPGPRPRAADYLLSDQGFMNVALGYRGNHQYDSAFAHAVRHGMRPNSPKPVEAGVFRVMYVNDRNGFSVEMLNARRALWSMTGFNARGPYVENEIEINAPADVVWQQLTDHAGLGHWSFLEGRVLREGRDVPNGLGCIRELSGPGMRLTEEITAWREGSHYAYQLRTGAPFKTHQGDVFVREKGGVTHVRWAIRFQSWIPFTGKLTAALLQRVFRKALVTLKSRLETTGFNNPGGASMPQESK
jgi:catechol 2,3-dioxygenase-like lactoylglutathione lyase family enzyme